MRRKTTVKKTKSFPLYAVEDPEAYGMKTKDVQKAWQGLVNTGMAWKLQGWYGRTAADMLASGYIKPPKKKTKLNQVDYYGNKIYK